MKYKDFYCDIISESNEKNCYGFFIDRSGNSIPVSEWGGHAQVASSILKNPNINDSISTSYLMEKRGYLRVSAPRSGTKMYVESIPMVKYDSLTPQQRKTIETISHDRKQEIILNGSPIFGELNEEIQVKYMVDGQPEYDDDDENVITDFHNQIQSLEKTSGISILRNKELSLVLVEDNIIIGALYTELSNLKFSFDVIVHPQHRNKGIGDKLIKLGLSNYKELKNSYDDEIKLVIDCVNPLLINTFKKNGLKVVKTDGKHTIMTL